MRYRLDGWKFRPKQLLIPLLIALSCLILACNSPIEQPPPLSAIEQLPTASTPTEVAISNPPAATSAPDEPTPPPAPTAEPNPSAVLPTEQWQTIAPGLEHRLIPVQDVNGLASEQLFVLRIDPTLYRFDVAYRPTDPSTLPQWLDETGALIVLNGGFFTAEYYATGLTIANGEVSGATYDFGGMISIRDGVLDLQALSAEPYTSNNPPDAGLQAFPMLVNRDGSAAFTEASVNRARRTIIAQDKSGMVLFMIADRSYFTLTELSGFLAASDLDLAIAFNLDGGPSSGLLIREPELAIPSPVLLPTVLTVYRR